MRTSTLSIPTRVISVADMHQKSFVFGVFGQSVLFGRTEHPIAHLILFPEGYGVKTARDSLLSGHVPIAPRVLYPHINPSRHEVDIFIPTPLPFVNCCLFFRPFLTVEHTKRYVALTDTGRPKGTAYKASPVNRLIPERKKVRKIR